MAPIILSGAAAVLNVSQDDYLSGVVVALPAQKREACSTSWGCMTEGSKAGIILLVSVVVMVLLLSGWKLGGYHSWSGWRGRRRAQRVQDEEVGFGAIELQPIPRPAPAYRRLELRSEEDPITGRRALRTRSVRRPEAEVGGEEEGAGPSSNQQEQSATIRQVTAEPTEPAIPTNNFFGSEQAFSISPSPSPAPSTLAPPSRSSMESVPPPPPPPAHPSQAFVAAAPVFVAPPPPLHPPRRHAPPPTATYVAYPPPVRRLFPPRVDSLPQPPSSRGPSNGPQQPDDTRGRRPNQQSPLLRQIFRMPSPGRAATMSSNASTSRFSPASDTAQASVPRGLLSGSNVESSVSGFDEAELAIQRALREDRADREERERISALRDEPRRASRARARSTSASPPPPASVTDESQASGSSRRSHRRRTERSTSRPPASDGDGSNQGSRSELSWSAVGTVGSGANGASSTSSGQVAELRRRLHALTGREEEEEGR